MDWFVPLVGTLGVGGFLGWAAANFIKTAGRIIGCLVGLVFVLMQVLAYYGIAEWHWDTLAPVVEGVSGAAKSSGGTLWKILTYNLPFSGGFGAGFWLTMKRR